MQIYFINLVLYINPSNCPVFSFIYLFIFPSLSLSIFPFNFIADIFLVGGTCSSGVNIKGKRNRDRVRVIAALLLDPVFGSISYSV